MTMTTVKLLVKMAGPDGVHMPGDLVQCGSAMADRLQRAKMAVGPNDPMPEKKASDFRLQASGEKDESPGPRKALAVPEV